MPIEFAGVQSRLAAARLDVGTVDGKPGPRTYAALLAYVASRASAGPQTTAIAAAMATHLPAYSIDANVARLANFIGQACHETMGWQCLKELWGPTAAQRGYEGRADLGNTQSGDGQRFMGRGIFQLTGRANYAHMGEILGLDLVSNPALAEQPDTAVLTACEFWKTRGLSALADQGLEDRITIRINGGLNGAPERRALVARANSILGGQ